MTDGREAHRALQKELKAIYGSDVEIEKYIKGAGYADIVYTVNGIKEVYEINPGFYSPNVVNNAAGKEQLNKYVKGLKANGKPDAKAGSSLNFIISITTLSSLRHPDQMVKYYTYPEDPGMIYWSHLNKLKGEWTQGGTACPFGGLR